MRRDLVRRLNAVEADRFGSPRVAAILRAFDAMSDREFAELIATGRNAVYDPQTLNDRELDCLITELRAASPVPDAETNAELNRSAAEIAESWGAGQ